MRVEELRIGNIVKTLQGVGRVEQIRHTGKHGHGVVLEGVYGGSYIEYCEGVPLTEEVLLKCGFGRDKNENYYLICPTGVATHSIYIMYEIAGKDIVGYMWFGKRTENTNSIYLRAEHLHELQNLYFELTGKELEVRL
jgi:hypothetical protein